MWIDELLKVILSFGGVYCLLIAYLYRFTYQKRSDNRLAAYAMPLYSVVFFQAYFAVQGIFFEPAFLNYMHLPVIWITGPVSYTYFLLLADPLQRYRKISFYIYGPTIVVALLLPAAEMVGYPLRKNPFHNYFTLGTMALPEWLFVLGVVQDLLCQGYMIRKTKAVYSEVLSKLRRTGLLIFVFHSAIPVTILLLFSCSLMFREAYFVFYGAALLSLYFALLYIFLAHYRDDIESITAAVQAGYKKSQLDGYDVASLSATLKRLVDEERIYLAEDLTAKKLADQLDLRVHQLSEFLNIHMGQNFSSLISSYRVEEAGRRLQSEPNANILNIAFDVGFRSKSTFNRSFKKHFGKSPREYLQANKA